MGYFGLRCLQYYISFYYQYSMLDIFHFCNNRDSIFDWMQSQWLLSTGFTNTGGNEGQNIPFRGKNSKLNDFCWFCLLGVLLITKKNPNKTLGVKTCFLAVFSKWPLLIYCNITKNARIINHTSFPTFLGSRNPMKVLFLRSEFNFSF